MSNNRTQYIGSNMHTEGLFLFQHTQSNRIQKSTDRPIHVDADTDTASTRGDATEVDLDPESEIPSSVAAVFTDDTSRLGACADAEDTDASALFADAEDEDEDDEDEDEDDDTTASGLPVAT